MELIQKIETRVLCSAAGRALRLDYCLLAQTEGPAQKLTGPYGLEIVLTDREGTHRERCRNLTGNYRKAIALIHVFASNSILPPSMLEQVKKHRFQ